MMSNHDEDLSRRLGLVAERLVERVPQFRPIYEEHKADNEGDVLAHLLWGDLTRFVFSAWAAGDLQTVDAVVAFNEEAIQSDDPEVRNLVKDSFVESCGPYDELPWDFIRTWPPHLRAEAERQWGFPP